MIFLVRVNEERIAFYRLLTSIQEFATGIFCYDSYMNKKRIVQSTFLLLMSALLTGCSVMQNRQPLGGFEQENTTSVGESSLSVDDSVNSVEYQVEQFVTGLEVPWSIVFTSPQRMLVTERPGRIREIVDGRVVERPLLSFTEVSSTSEEGLMGLAIDPEYSQTKWVYTAFAYESEGKLWVKVVRFKDDNPSIDQVETLLDNIPAARNHAGTRLHFGPGGALFVSTGDGLQKDQAQNLQSLAGKMLRMNPDGTIPSDNPYPNSYVFSYGHRNMQGFDWHPQTQQLFATEHGPSSFDGPPGGDEINHLISKGNYGWPLVSHERTRAGTIAPLRVYTPAVAPASGMFYSGRVFPQWRHHFFFGGLRGEGLFQLSIDADNNTVMASEKLDQVQVGRVREVTEGPDGLIYFSSSNRDGRGNARPGDDAIYRLVPKK